MSMLSPNSAASPRTVNVLPPKRGEPSNTHTVVGSLAFASTATRQAE